MTRLENFVGKFKNFLKFRSPKLIVSYTELDVVLDLLKVNETGITSKTFYKLMTPEFRLEKNVDETGMKMTTLVDKKTGKPVRAYVAKLKEKNALPNEEEYSIMLESQDGELEHANKKYRIIGTTRFFINTERKMVMPRFDLIEKNGTIYERSNGYMKSLENADYAGIGLRLHQIRIERMLQCKLGNSFIVAEGNSFPFHYSLGYRLSPFTEQIEVTYPLMSQFANLNKTPIMENTKYIFVDKKDGKFVVDYSASMEYFLDDYYKNGGKTLEDIMPNMFLTKKSIEQWIALIRQQPILY